MLVLLWPAAELTVTAAAVGAVEPAVTVVRAGAASTGHLRDACGVPHSRLTTSDVVTCC